MFYEYLVRSRFRSRIGWNCYNFTKFVAALTLVIVALVHAIHVSIISSSDQVTKAHLLSVWLSFATCALFITFLHLQRTRGFINCGCNWFYLLLVVIFNAFAIATAKTYRPNNLIIYSYIEYALQVLLFLMSSFSDKVDNIEEIILFGGKKQEKHCSSLTMGVKITTTKEEKTNPKLCPKELSSVPSKLTFWWFNGLAIKGWRRPLTVQDLWRLPAWNNCEYLFNSFNALWQHPKFIDHKHHHQSKNDSNQQAAPRVNLWIMFAKMFWPYFLFPTIARVFTDLLQLSNSIVLK